MHEMTTPPAARRGAEHALRHRPIMTKSCTHLSQVRAAEPRTPEGCEECLQMAGRWVHLRLCLSCGHVGCCDSSPNRHATAHHHETGHPIIRSFEPNEAWAWCYVDQVVLKASAINAAITGTRARGGR
jgi:uncharacterized UBP type Zn finger protein